jgi:outer membrane protein assembly factor BamD (BamD/ComL family)
MNADTRDKAIEPRPLRRDDNPAPENAELADLFRRVKPRGPLHELAVQRIRRGLEQRIGPTASRRQRWTRTVLAVAASLFLIETFAALAISAWPSSRRSLMRTLQGPPPALPSSEPSALAERGQIPDDNPAPAAMPSAPSTLPSVATPGRPRRMQEEQKRVRAPSEAIVADRTIDDAEVTAYLGALAELNVRNDPAKALSMLEAYRSQHPQGLFRDEVTVAEVRADMALGREREALALLDGMQTGGFAGLPQADELALLRVELLGRANRCPEALSLLVPDLQASLPAAQREQLLFERGACDAELGNLESSQQDLRDYVRQFPHGRFEVELRQRIARAIPASE